MATIHPIKTGHVRIKTAQRKRRLGGLPRVLVDTEWTEWLPIYAWAIEHPEGIFVVDTGDTARTSEAGYFPKWHPYYRTSVKMDIAPSEEIGPQLRKIGIDPSDVRKVILTHFHTDHAGGLHHFRNSEILVDEGDYRRAQGLTGRLQGFLPHRWPDWFSPTPIKFEEVGVGPFKKSYAVTEAGDILVVPTPGHTAGHVSVIVRSGGLEYFLAGDTSYFQSLLLEREPDGVSPNRKVAVQTIDSIIRFAMSTSIVYLPSHDPESVHRLHNKETLLPAPMAAA